MNIYRKTVYQGVSLRVYKTCNYNPRQYSKDEEGGIRSGRCGLIKPMNSALSHTNDF